MTRVLLFVYQILLVLLAPLAWLLIVRDAKRRNGGKRFICQRFGYGYPGCDQQPLWVHAASLGEVNAIKPLIRQLHEMDPGQTILLTTATPAGAQAADTLKIKSLKHAYLPVDLPMAVKRFFKAYNPKRFLVVETELWPNLYHQAQLQGCPPTIVNGRLSRKSIGQRWLYPLLRYCMLKCEMIYTRSKQDNIQFQAIGADPDRLLNVGNIKFAAQPESQDDYPRLVERAYILAASTHNDEESQFCEALKHTGQLLVIIPRHPERRDEILKQLAEQSLNVAVRSLDDQVLDSTDVYLADTMGEMMAFMAHAELVFMGGSLIPHGGQNMLEPARLGKATITGPHTHNFADEVAALDAAESIVIVKDKQALKAQAETLLEQAERCQQMGDNAKELIVNNAGIAKQYVKLLVTQWGLKYQ